MKRVDRQRSRGKAGMTLIEVILAVSILSAAFAVLLTAASRCLAVIRAARMYEESLWTLGRGEADHPMRIVDTIEDLNVDPQTYDNGCTYSRQVEDDEDEDELYVVRTRVTWADRGKENTEEVLRYVWYEKKP